jgi:hypothetical protein
MSSALREKQNTASSSGSNFIKLFVKKALFGEKKLCTVMRTVKKL